MAKPMLVTLPVVLLLLDCWPLGRWDRRRLLAAAAAAAWRRLPLFALAAASASSR